MSMNEQTQAQVFNDMLDAVIAGDEVTVDPGEVSEAVRLAGYLHRLDLASNTTALRRRIRAQLIVRKEEGNNMAKRRQIVIVTALILVLIGLFALSPIGALAQSILRQIGGISLSSERSPIERLAEEDPVVEFESEGTAIPTATPPANLSGAEVNGLADFDGWLPSFVPEGYELADHYVVRDHAGSPLIRTGYTQEDDDSFSFFTIDQMVTVEEPEAPLGRWDIGDAPIVDVQVNSSDAVYVEQANIIALPDEENESGFTPAGANILIWVVDEYTFTMVSMHLDQATMIAIAESMQAP
jgi:hypothetical protein